MIADDNTINELARLVDLSDQLVEQRTVVDRVGGPSVLVMRQRLKFSQRKLADVLGISFTTVSKIERGHLPVSVTIARKCLEIYGESVAASEGQIHEGRIEHGTV